VLVQGYNRNVYFGGIRVQELGNTALDRKCILIEEHKCTQTIGNDRNYIAMDNTSTSRNALEKLTKSLFILLR
jgi:hypothetical protein